jgi:hypothetical protein
VATLNAPCISRVAILTNASKLIATPNFLIGICARFLGS